MVFPRSVERRHVELNAHCERDSNFFSDLICKRLGRFDGAQASPLRPNPNAAQNAADASSRMQGGSSAVGSKPAPPVESSVPAARAVIGCELLLDEVNRDCSFAWQHARALAATRWLLQRQQEFETPDSRAGPCFPPECPQPSHLYAFDKHHHAADIDPRTRHSRRVRAAER